MFAPARLLDPLRIVQGTATDRYDCPDLAAVDRHLDRLRCRLAGAAGRCPALADGCRADIDRLLDRRCWLTLPVADTRRGTVAGHDGRALLGDPPPRRR